VVKRKYKDKNYYQAIEIIIRQDRREYYKAIERIIRQVDLKMMI